MDLNPFARFAGLLAILMVIAAMLLISGHAVAQHAHATPAEQQMQKILQMYKPELRERVMALSPETRKHLMEELADEHEISEQATLRQVMHEILANYQAIAAGIATDNGEMAADAARRLAKHRLPRGGLFPYLRLEQITDADLGVLPAMEEAVEGTALRLAEAAGRGDMGVAAKLLGEVMNGCVACHQHFRGRPGVSPLLAD